MPGTCATVPSAESGYLLPASNPSRRTLPIARTGPRRYIGTHQLQFRMAIAYVELQYKSPKYTT